MIAFHVTVGVLAIVTGFYALVLSAKGSRAHKLVGKLYVVCMLALTSGSFFIYEVSGSLSVFHGISVIVTLLLLAALVPLYRRPRLPNALAWHYRFMGYAYISLTNTTTVQFFENLPFESAALNAVFFLTLPAFVMWALLEWRAQSWSRQFAAPETATG